MNELLKQYIEKSGYKLKFIAKQLGITYVALRNKLDCKYEFTVNEAIRLKQILNISDEDWKEIFENEIIQSSK